MNKNFRVYIKQLDLTFFMIREHCPYKNKPEVSLEESLHLHPLPKIDCKVNNTTYLKLLQIVLDVCASVETVQLV